MPQLDDDPEFVRRVELTVNGILRSHSPASLAVIKIDNWFGARWLGFSGKFGGIAGFTLKPSFRTRKRLRIPLFVPERVVFQRRFSGPEFEGSTESRSICMSRAASHSGVWRQLRSPM